MNIKNLINGGKIMKFLNCLLISIIFFVVSSTTRTADPGPALVLRWFVVPIIKANGAPGNRLAVKQYYLAGLTAGILKADMARHFFSLNPKDVDDDIEQPIKSNDIAGVVLKEVASGKSLYVSLADDDEMIRPIIEDFFGVQEAYALSVTVILKISIENGLYRIPSDDGMDDEMDIDIDYPRLNEFQREFYDNLVEKLRRDKRK